MILPHLAWLAACNRYDSMDGSMNSSKIYRNGNPPRSAGDGVDDWQHRELTQRNKKQSLKRFASSAFMLLCPVHIQSICANLAPNPS